MATLTILPLLIFFILFPHSSSDPNPTSKTLDSNVSAAHAELSNYGFPVGLLPTNVVDYSINQTSGEFSVNLGYSCKFTLPPDNYLATYSPKISGKIVHGHIASLAGIRVRAFFQWWSITGIRSSGDNLVFEVGVVTAKYPAKNFHETPVCEGHRSVMGFRLLFHWTRLYAVRKSLGNQMLR
uniref:DUF538 domain-containing protein n=2 Tax=Vitis vinifera TaxID=29760 RepID=F6HH38_VITVI